MWAVLGPCRLLPEADYSVFTGLNRPEGNNEGG